MNEMIEKQINNIYDYSNIVAEIENVCVLIKYCDYYYNHILKLCNEDEEKNLKLKSEYKVFNFKKGYSTELNINIMKKTETNRYLEFNSYDSFIDSVKNNDINDIDRLVIGLDLSFRRGKDLEMTNHENVFKISFEPYNITFTRKSNYDDPMINEIENTINSVLKQFKVQNTIFCTK